MDKINSPCFEVIAVLQAMRHFFGKSTFVLSPAVRAAFDFTTVFTHLHLYRRNIIDLPALVRKALYVADIFPTATTLNWGRVLDDGIRGFTELQGSPRMPLLTASFFTAADAQAFGAMNISGGRFAAILAVLV